MLTQQPGGSGGGEGAGGANCGSLAGRAAVATLLTAAGPNPRFLCAPPPLPPRPVRPLLPPSASCAPPPRPVSPLPSCGQHTAVPHSACLTQPQTAGNHMPLFPRAFPHCVVQQGVLLALGRPGGGVRPANVVQCQPDPLVSKCRLFKLIFSMCIWRASIISQNQNSD